MVLLLLPDDVFTDKHKNQAGYEFCQRIPVPAELSLRGRWTPGWGGFEEKVNITQQLARFGFMLSAFF
jgi:hypothetical protein